LEPKNSRHFNNQATHNALDKAVRFVGERVPADAWLGELKIREKQ
jgi:hypothetical protein